MTPPFLKDVRPLRTNLISFDSLYLFLYLLGTLW